jgi:sporulation protein YlmC with PRC-barrel domain
MHVRLSTCLGTEVIDRSTGDILGMLSGLFVHPDTGKLEGIFVAFPAGLFGSSQRLFCGSDDIVHWGATVQVRNHNCLSPVEDRIRLVSLVEEGRGVIGQRIRTEAGRPVGFCKDIQIDTEKMRLEWLFPRRFFRQGIAIPAADIVEVRREAIVVRDALQQIPVSVSSPKEEPAMFESFPEIAEARVSD